MTTPQEMARIVSVLSAAYPTTPVRPETIEVYQRLLGHHPYELLQAATLHAISRCKFFPTVAEINQALAEIMDQATDRRSGLEAWGDVLAEVRRVGYLRAPEFKDPVTARIVKSMGWQAICMSDNEIADRARFIQAYDQAVARDKALGAMMPEVIDLARRLSAGQDSLLLQAPKE